MPTKPTFTLLTCLIILTLLLPISTKPVAADTDSPLIENCSSYSGVIRSDTTWSPATCNPYIINGNVQVDSGATLTVQPGTVIKFNNYVLDIRGTLLARGTAEQPILFTSNKATPQPGDWPCIWFSDSSINATFDIDGNYTGGNIIQHATLEYANGCYVYATSTAAIAMSGATPYLDHVHVRYSKYAAVGGVASGEFRVTNSNIQNNGNRGFEVRDPWYVVMTGNTISKNQGTGIYVAGESDMLFSSNVITGNLDSGMYIVSSYCYQLKKFNFIGNRIAENMKSGVHIHSCNDEAYFTSNSIIGNGSTDSAGIRLLGKATLRGNQITQNHGWGGGFQLLEARSKVTFEANNIFNNTAADQSVPLNLVANDTNYNTNNPIDARNTWWGLTDSTAIAASIYEFDDNNRFNDVLHEPFRSTPVYMISGHALDSNGKPITNATITAGNGMTTTTDTSGAYFLGGLDGGSYTLTIARRGYSFVPASRSVTIGPDATQQDFTGTRTSYAVGGRIVDKNNQPFTNATITDETGRTTTTDANGNYLLTNLPVGAHTLIPSRQGYVFTPDTRNVTITNADLFGQDFTAEVETFTLGGRIVDNTGAPLADVTIDIGSGRTTKSDANGNYRFSGLTTGNYNVRPSRSGYAMSPDVVAVTLPPSKNDVNFTAGPTIYTLAGRIVDTSGNGLPGVTVQTGGRTVTSDSSGNFTLTNLAAGVHTLTPVRSGYMFAPRTLEVRLQGNLNNVHFQGDLSNGLTPKLLINYFTGQPGSYFTITGANYPPNRTVTISINGRSQGTAQTDAQGGFSLIVGTTNAGLGAYRVVVTVNPTEITAAEAQADPTTSFVLAPNAPLRDRAGAGTEFNVPAGIAGQELYLPLIRQR